MHTYKEDLALSNQACHKTKPKKNNKKKKTRIFNING